MNIYIYVFFVCEYAIIGIVPPNPYNSYMRQFFVLCVMNRSVFQMFTSV